MKINSWVLLIVLIFLLIVLAFFYHPKNQLATTEVIINNHRFNVEIANTESEREYGLMNRTHLDENTGMFFVFPNSDIYPFWMKNTKIPLDIIWISDNNIVDIKTLKPQTDDNIPEYTPKNKANYVLELNAGLAVKYNFKIGDEVEIH